MAEILGNNSQVTNRFLYGPDVDMVLSEQQFSSGTAQNPMWQLTDHLGTVRGIAQKPSGGGNVTVVNSLQYDAFGKITSQTNSANQPQYGFAGRDIEPVGDLTNNRHRYYGTSSGRFISQDPISFAAGDSNLYRYVGNKPTTFTDPSGLAEGQHWIPISEVTKLWKEKLISDADRNYFGGRMSGPIGPHGWDKEHSQYNKAVAKELQSWIDNGSDDRKAFVDNIKAGKSWDGSVDVPAIKDYNDKYVHPRVPNYGGPNPYDSGTDAEIEERGRKSIENREKAKEYRKRKAAQKVMDTVPESGIIKKIGIGLGLVAAVESTAKGTEILTQSEPILRAKEKFQLGKIDEAEWALIGVGHPKESVYEMLLLENAIFATAYREAVRRSLESYREQLNEPVNEALLEACDP